MTHVARTGPRHARTPGTAARGPALVLTVVLTAVTSAAGAVYLDLRAQMDVSNAQGLVLATPAPAMDAPDDPFAGHAMNILLMGTDLRDAKNAALAGEDDGMKSDTTMLVHVSGDRTWAEVVSIPRDSLVDVPECLLPDGSRSRPRSTMFNKAFEIGAGPQRSVDHAAACAIGTVQSLTGVTITHHVVVKMAGVIDVVDALGGVRMCLPEPVDEDPRYGDLHLPAGEQRLGGRQAIGFLRVRSGTGMGLELGSDLTRITRQQAFVQAATRELLAKDMLGDADALYRVARAVLGALTPDPQLRDPVRLAAFGYSLRGLDRSRIVFTDVPVTEARSDRNRLEWTAAADELWQRIATDTPPPVLAPPTPAGGADDGGAGGGGAGGDGGTDDGGGDGGTDDGATGVPGGSDGAADGATGGASSGGPGAPDGPGAGTDPLGEELLPGVCAT